MLRDPSSLQTSSAVTEKQNKRKAFSHVQATQLMAWISYRRPPNAKSLSFAQRNEVVMVRWLGFLALLILCHFTHFLRTYDMYDTLPSPPHNIAWCLASKAAATMTLSFLFPTPLRHLILHRPLLIYAVSWTAVLTASVAVASFSPEIAFVWAVSPASPFSKVCREGEAIRVLVSGPGEAVCLPAQLFRMSKMDMVVPPTFAALVVAGSACFVRALGLWEGDSAI